MSVPILMHSTNSFGLIVMIFDLYIRLCFFLAVGQSQSHTEFSLSSGSGQFSQGREICDQNQKVFARIETTKELEAVKNLLQRKHVTYAWIPLKKITSFTTTNRYGCLKLSKVEDVKSRVQWFDGGDPKVSDFPWTTLGSITSDIYLNSCSEICLRATRFSLFDAPCTWSHRFLCKGKAADFPQSVRDARGCRGFNK